MDKLKKIKEQSGFTLLEVMVASVILTVALISLGALSTTVIRSNSFSNQFTVATFLAQDELEQLMNLDYDDAGLNVGNYNDGGTIDESGNAGGIYTRSWTVAEPEPNIQKDIVVTVTWSSLGSSKTVSISTIKNNG